jgi:hypothetical protein
MITRRGLLEAAGGAMAGTGSLPALAGATAGRADTGFWLSPLLPAGTRAEAALETLANKKPLIRLTGRPPNYEAPLSYLRTVITPNEFTPERRGKLSFAARATNRIGQTQTNEPVQNPAGYHHNAIQTVTLDVV